MNGDTTFIDAQELDYTPDSIVNIGGNLWSVVNSGRSEILLEAPDVAGDKVYDITVDDVSLLYDSVKNKLVWSVTWSRT